MPQFKWQRMFIIIIVLLLYDKNNGNRHDIMIKISYCDCYSFIMTMPTTYVHVCTTTYVLSHCTHAYTESHT